MKRIENLAAAFLAVESSGDLADAMVEGGLVVAELHRANLINLNDILLNWIERAKKPVDRPHGDSELSDFCWQEVFRYYADSTSERERTLYHVTARQGSSVSKETRLHVDYEQQAKRYAMFCDELLELIGPKGNQSNVDLPKRRRRKADELTNAQEALATAIETHHQYEATTLSCGNCEPVSYSKLLELSGVRSKDTTKTFFDAWLSDGNAEYQRLCKSGDAKALALAIAKLSKTGALAMARYSAELLADSKANRQDED